MGEEIRCPMCSKLNPPGTESCAFCGARLKPLLAPAAPDESSPGLSPSAPARSGGEGVPRQTGWPVWVRLALQTKARPPVRSRIGWENSRNRPWLPLGRNPGTKNPVEPYRLRYRIGCLGSGSGKRRKLNQLGNPSQKGKPVKLTKGGSPETGIVENRSERGYLPVVAQPALQPRRLRARRKAQRSIGGAFLGRGGG